MNQSFVPLGIVVAVLLLAGCASSGQSTTPPDTARDLAEMKERILELQEKAAMAQVEMDRLRQQLSGLEQQLAEAQSSGSRAMAMEGGGVPVREVTPAPVMTPTTAVVEESDLEIEPRSEPSSGGQQIDLAAGAPGAQPPTLQPVEPAAQALYDRGYTLYHQGQYLDAEASFQRFLQAYPSTELSDNAQFWIGESRYARGDIRGALAAFRETLQRYPEGNKIPDALIKEGDCLEKLGDTDGARERYEEVKRRFPTSAAAVMAEERLSGLG